MKQFRIVQQLGNSEVTIVPHVLPIGFNKVESFMVSVICFPAFKGGYKCLMREVCRILSSIDGVEIKTHYVVTNIATEGENFDVKSICFQVVTPLSTSWYL